MIEAPAGSRPVVPGLERTPGEHGRSRDLSLSSAGLTALLQGAALMAMVAWDGTAWWRVARVAAVSVTTMSVVSLQRRRRPRLAGFAAWAWGAVGVAVGLGIGVVHVLRVGPSAYAALALVCLVTGIVATTRVISDLSHLLPGWRRLIVLGVALVALILVYYPLTVALIATDPPRVDIGTTLPSDLGLVYEDVRFATSDGIEIAGWFMPGSNGAAVVLLHGGGAASNRTAVLSHARVLVDNGYSVLAFDARGHGRSGGHGMEWGWYGDLDIAGALEFLESREEIDPGRLAAAGLSMGGEQAITAAASDPRIKAVVAEGATNRVLADDDAFLPKHPGRWVNIAADWVKYGIADWISGSRPPMALTSAVMATAPRPVLVISAGKVADERHAALAFQAAAPTNVKLWDIPGATHTSGLATAPVEWENRVIEFLDAAVGK